MRHVIFTLLCLGLSFGNWVHAQCNDLFISEYMEGSDQNRCLEIYNPTGEPITLTGVYRIAIASNGGPVDRTVNLDGSIAPGEVFVICDPDQNLGITTDQTDNDIFFTGDDAIALQKNTTDIDVIGQIGFDPGSRWDVNGVRTKERTLRRKSAIVSGDADGSDTFDPSAEWDSFSQNTADGFGEHTVSGAAIPTPPVPLEPTKGVCMSADVTSNVAEVGITVRQSSFDKNTQRVVWVLTGKPAGSSLNINDQFTVDNCGDQTKDFGELGVRQQSQAIKINNPATAPLGTYTFDAFIETCATGCISSSVSGFSLTINNTFPDAPEAQVATNAFCLSSTLSPNINNTGVWVKLSSLDKTKERIVWVLTGKPAGSTLSLNSEFTVDDCGDQIKEFGEISVRQQSQAIRVDNPGSALVGTYTFDAYVESCETGCSSTLTSGFSITVNAAPTVDIMADPDGAICLGTTGVMYDATIVSTDGGTYTYDWCAYNATNGGGTCFGGFTPGGDNASQTRNWTSSPGAKSVGVEVMSEVPGCMASTIYNFQVVNIPPGPVADKTDGRLCVGQDAATVFVDDPGMNREIVWVVLEAPAGASFAMGDDLEPNVNASDYRTDLDANGRRLRIKNNAAVGTYRFKAKTRETSAGCESAPTTEEFTITVNATPAVPTIDRQDLVRCRRETATISVLPATDVEFVWEVLEAPNGVSFAAGDRLEPGV
ncbi:MAG: lamin tail domain-containing protein, partial [Bacteroidota bacterium]